MDGPRYRSVSPVPNRHFGVSQSSPEPHVILRWRPDRHKHRHHDGWRKHIVVTGRTAAQPTPPGRRHILLVDDDPTFSQAMGQVLRRAGFDVTLAADFRLALEVLEAEGQVDLLISDIVMPSSVNGIALSRMARLRRRELKVLYLTGYNIPGAENEALGPILRKPIDEEQLVAEVERLLTAA